MHTHNNAQMHTLDAHMRAVVNKHAFLLSRNNVHTQNHTYTQAYKDSYPQGLTQIHTHTHTHTQLQYTHTCTVYELIDS